VTRPRLCKDFVSSFISSHNTKNLGKKQKEVKIKKICAVRLTDNTKINALQMRNVVAYRAHWAWPWAWRVASRVLARVTSIIMYRHGTSNIYSYGRTRHTVSNKETKTVDLAAGRVPLSTRSTRRLLYPLLHTKWCANGVRAAR
jgi:hypothetical protein